MIVKFLADLLDGLTCQDVRDSLPLNSIEIERLPIFLHCIQIVLHRVLTESKVSLAFQILNMLLGLFHRGKRLLCDVTSCADLLGHLRDMDFFEALGGQCANNWDLFLEFHEPIPSILGKLFELLQPGSLEGILKTSHSRVEFLPLRLDFLSIKLIHCCVHPGSLILTDLRKGLPEFLEGLDLLLACFEKRELFNIVLEVSLLLVDILALLT